MVKDFETFPGLGECSRVEPATGSAEISAYLYLQVESTFGLPDAANIYLGIQFALLVGPEFIGSQRSSLDVYSGENHKCQ
jgi:hypothetical protein